VPDFLLGVGVQLLVLDRDLSGDLVLVHPGAVGCDHEANDHDNRAVETSEVTKEVEEGVGLP